MPNWTGLSREVQQLGRQIAERQEAALELESLVARAEAWAAEFIGESICLEENEEEEEEEEE